MIASPYGSHELEEEEEVEEGAAFDDSIFVKRNQLFVLLGWRKLQGLEL